ALELRAERRGRPKPRVLVERRGEPIRRQRGRRRPTDDEVKETWPGRAGGCRHGVVQLLQRRKSAVAGLRQAAADCFSNLVCARVADEALVERREERLRLRERELERGLVLAAQLERVGHE